MIFRFLLRFRFLFSCHFHFRLDFAISHLHFAISMPTFPLFSYFFDIIDFDYWPTPPAPHYCHFLELILKLTLIDIFSDIFDFRLSFDIAAIDAPPAIYYASFLHYFRWLMITPFYFIIRRCRFSILAPLAAAIRRFRHAITAIILFTPDITFWSFSAPCWWYAIPLFCFSFAFSYYAFSAFSFCLLPFFLRLIAISFRFEPWLAASPFRHWFSFLFDFSPPLPDYAADTPLFLRYAQIIFAIIAISTPILILIFIAFWPDIALSHIADAIDYFELRH